MSKSKDANSVLVWGMLLNTAGNGRRVWPVELKARAVKKIANGAKIVDVAKEIGAHKSLVAKWMRSDRVVPPIPLPAAGKALGGKRITPGMWEQRTDLRLRFVYRSRGPSLVVVDAVRLNTRA